MAGICYLNAVGGYCTMKYALVFLVLVLATAAAFSTTREECYSEVGTKVADLHAHNAAQNPSGSITTLTYGCSGTCSSAYSNCISQASAAASVCKPDASGTYDACFRVENSAWITCANNEIDCCAGEAKKTCDAAYESGGTTTPEKVEDAQGRNTCAEQLGPYGEYSSTSGCYCPTEYTIYNEYTLQCVLSTVYAYCEERNAAYDKATDSCICYEGYAPSGGMCVESGSGAGGGTLGVNPSAGASGGSSSGGAGAGTCFIVAPFALLALAVLAGKQI
jgi:hypothetical protein